VLELLDEAGIAVRAQSLGGTGYRRLSWVVGPDEPRCEVIEADAPET
jgi:hypothetical protein